MKLGTTLAAAAALSLLEEEMLTEKTARYNP